MIPILPKIYYKYLLKPLLFLQDAEKVHNKFTKIGMRFGKSSLGKKLIKILFSYKNKNLNKVVNDITFSNPIGLSAGFNYDGYMTEILNDVGFGFHTVGTVTAKPYEGNPGPRLSRLPKSKSLLVNKGFKSEGANEVAKTLDSMDLTNTTMGLSVGSSNTPEVNTIEKAIKDYIFTFKVFKDKSYVKYFELNISCPNTSMSENFTEKENLGLLLNKVDLLNIKQPIYIKMPNELTLEETNQLTDLAITYKSIKGFIFSNLVKKRTNENFNRDEIGMIRHLKGSFSGKPTQKDALKLIKNAKKRYGNKITIIGCGGVFSTDDAQLKLDAGADLVQLITGMIFEGPQLIGEINKGLSKSVK